MTRILRSMLYVPSNSWRMINNATTEGADAIILDLEDGCPIAEKETGRVFARESIPMLKQHGLGGFVQVMALLETPKGSLNIREIISASERVMAVGFGAGDFSREMGAGMGVTKLSPDEYFPMILHARSRLALAARAAGIQAMDTPYFGLVIDLEGLGRASEKGNLAALSV